MCVTWITLRSEVAVAAFHDEVQKKHADLLDGRPLRPPNPLYLFVVEQALAATYGKDDPEKELARVPRDTAEAERLLKAKIDTGELKPNRRSRFSADAVKRLWPRKERGRPAAPSHSRAHALFLVRLFTSQARTEKSKEVLEDWREELAMGIPAYQSLKSFARDHAKSAIEADVRFGFLSEEDATKMRSNLQTWYGRGRFKGQKDRH